MFKTVTKDLVAAAAIAAASLHATGVSLGHFGNDDFIDIIGKVAQILYGDLNQPSPTTTSQQASGVSS